MAAWTCEDKLRRARILSQGALEALRAYNYYPRLFKPRMADMAVAGVSEKMARIHGDPHFAKNTCRQYAAQSPPLIQYRNGRGQSI